MAGAGCLSANVSNPAPSTTRRVVPDRRASARQSSAYLARTTIWLGTTYYLSRDAIAGTLSTLAERVRPGSQLVLDYWRERPGIRADPLLWGARIATALSGEPMRSFFAPGQIEDLARAAGWRVVENCSPSEQNRRYLANRSDRLRVPSFAYLLRLEHQAKPGSAGSALNA